MNYLEMKKTDEEYPLFTTSFPPDEFEARRTKIMEKIGHDSIAVIMGAAESPVYVKFRQNNNFFYLTGVEVPWAMLLLDGKTRATTLFLKQNDAR